MTVFHEAQQAGDIATLVCYAALSAKIGMHRAGTALSSWELTAQRAVPIKESSIYRTLSTNYQLAIVSATLESSWGMFLKQARIERFIAYFRSRSAGILGWRWKARAAIFCISKLLGPAGALLLLGDSGADYKSSRPAWSAVSGVGTMPRA
jgi:hypothetical protein